jgi:uncharacterized protein (DUF1501 family)
MLRLITGENHRCCDGTTRREFLQVGTLALGGLTLPQLLAARAQATQAGRGIKDTSIVLLFLTGGPSQIETFDPKMSAPSDFRSVTGEVATEIPGVTIGGTFPQLARQAKRMTIVRSFTHANSDHTGAVQDVMRCGNPAEAGMGAIVARLRGTSHPRTGLPSHVFLSIKEPDPQFDRERMRLAAATGPGLLGGAYGAAEIGRDPAVMRDMELTLTMARLEDRRTLRRALDRMRLNVSIERRLDQFEQQALETILGKSKEAFDLSKEDPRLVRRYDTGRFNTALRVARRYSTLGKQMLLARRLCEAGCGFITIHNPGWDMHGGPTQFNVPYGMERLGRPLDQAVSTFLDDVHDRGLSEKILLIITGEFGRTPKVKADGGRDHWPRLSTLAFAGGGLKMGQVIGESNARAEEPKSRPVTLDNLLGTVLHAAFDVPTVRTLPNVPRIVTNTLDRAEPIHELFA